MATHGCGCCLASCPECNPRRIGWGEPAPTPNDGPSMHDLVITDMASRKQFGLAKYGTPLQAHNGRDALKDAYEEALDLVVYLRQELAERQAERERIAQSPYMQIDRPATTAEQTALDNMHLRGLLVEAVRLFRSPILGTHNWRIVSGDWHDRTTAALAVDDR